MTRHSPFRLSRIQTLDCIATTCLETHAPRNRIHNREAKHAPLATRGTHKKRPPPPPPQTYLAREHDREWHLRPLGRGPEVVEQRGIVSVELVLEVYHVLGHQLRADTAEKLLVPLAAGQSRTSRRHTQTRCSRVCISERGGGSLLACRWSCTRGMDGYITRQHTAAGSNMFLCKLPLKTTAKTSPRFPSCARTHAIHLSIANLTSVALVYGLVLRRL